MILFKIIKTCRNLKKYVYLMKLYFYPPTIIYKYHQPSLLQKFQINNMLCIIIKSKLMSGIDMWQWILNKSTFNTEYQFCLYQYFAYMQ